MSSIQSTNLYKLVGSMNRILGNRVKHVKGVRPCCNALTNLRVAIGNNYVKVRLYSMSFDNYCMALFSVTEKEITDPEL